MSIRINRDVLYFEEKINKSTKNLPISRDAPLHRKKPQDRGYPCLFLVKHPKTDTLSGRSAFWKGALTVEAAFSATAFFLVLFSLLFLFQIIAKQNRVRMSLATAVWQYETYGTKLGTIQEGLENDILIRWNEAEGICFAEQTFSIPFLGSRWFTVSVYQQLCINPYKGKSMAADKEKTGEYVYITDHGTVFHKNRNCVYLNPKIQKTSFDAISGKRNNSGAKYYACESCYKKVSGMDVVYYTPYGNRYHSCSDCSGLKRSIRKVERSSIGEMPACSKCAE